MNDWCYVAFGAGLCLYLTYRGAFALIDWQLKRWKGVMPGE